MADSEAEKKSKILVKPYMKSLGLNACLDELKTKTGQFRNVTSRHASNLTVSKDDTKS